MKTMPTIIATLMMLFTTACHKDEPATPSSAHLEDITITVGGHTYHASLEQNSTAEAFRNLLPLTLEMQELNGNEKYHYLSAPLLTNSTKPGTIHAGDLMLYGDRCVVLFYETFSTSYSYSSIGRITDTGGLKAALGTGSTTVQFTANTSRQHPRQ